jgi:hypothetical protein
MKPLKEIKDRFKCSNVSFKRKCFTINRMNRQRKLNSKKKQILDSKELESNEVK